MLALPDGLRERWRRLVGLAAPVWAHGVALGWGVAGAVAGQVLTYVLFIAVTGWGYLRTDWAGRAAAMMDERGTREAGDG